MDSEFVDLGGVLGVKECGDWTLAVNATKQPEDGFLLSNKGYLPLTTLPGICQGHCTLFVHNKSSSSVALGATKAQRMRQIPGIHQAVAFTELEADHFGGRALTLGQCLPKLFQGKS